MQILLHSSTAPAGFRHITAVIVAKDEDSLAMMPLCSNIERIELGDGRYFFGIAAEKVFGLDRKLTGQDLGLDADHQRHRALARLEAEVWRKRSPRTMLHVLTYQVGKQTGTESGREKACK